MYILPLTVGYSGQYAGEAPQLSCPNPADTAGCTEYGKYDNGVNVFDAYWNFSGTTAPAGWTTLEGTVSYNNGITLSATSDAYYSSSQYAPSQYVLEGMTQSTTAAWGGLIWATSWNAGGGAYGLENGQTSGATGLTEQVYSVNGGSGAYANGAGTSTPFMSGMHWDGTSNATGYINYASPLAAPTTDAPAISKAYAGAGAWGGGYITFDWLRIRTYPPGGVMPVAHIGSVSIIS